MNAGSIISILSILIAFFSCSTIPQGVTAVSPFDKAQYLGKWFEIARFDFKFERGLNNTSAEYTLRNDGTIKVVNRGYDYEHNLWKEAIGTAKFVENDTTAMLKVSFFGPFYGGYNLIAIDPDYKYALVCGSSLEYLWILSREKSIPETVKQEYLDTAERLGFDISKLLWIEHN